MRLNCGNGSQMRSHTTALEHMSAQVLLEHLSHQAVHRVSSAGDELKRRCAAVLILKSTLDRLAPPLDSAPKGFQIGV